MVPTNVLASVLKRQKQWTLCVSAKEVNLQAELMSTDLIINELSHNIQMKY